jgi:hypothetical protein
MVIGEGHDMRDRNENTQSRPLAASGLLRCARASFARRAAAAGLVATSALWCTMARAQSYYIDENLSYTGHPPCSNNPNLNVVTASLQKAMDGAGWYGWRFTDAASWPSDFTESCNSDYGPAGTDVSFADGHTLAVFAGHGRSGLMAWGFEHDGVCAIDFQKSVRLGQMDGARAAFGMWLACDVLAPGTLPTEGNYQWLRQQFSFANSIAIGDDEPADFFDATAGSTNRDAWLGVMGTDHRQAIVVTYDNDSETNCWIVHNTASLRDEAYSTPRGGGPSCGQPPPDYWYCYEYAD